MRRVQTLVRAELRTVLGRHRSLTALIAVFVALILVAQAVVGAGVAHYAAQATHRSALSLIEVSGVSAQARQPVTNQTVVQMRKVPQVVGVYPWYQHDLELRDTSDWASSSTNPGALWATPVIPGLAPKLVVGAYPKAGLSDTDIVLPDEVPGGSLRKLLGHTVRMEYTKVVSAGNGEPAYLNLTVVGIGDNSVPGQDGPTPSYVSYNTLMKLNGGQTPSNYTTAYVQASSTDAVPAVQTALAKEGFAVSSLASQAPDLGSLFNILKDSVWVFFVLLILACISIGSATGSTWLRQRYTDIGLFRAIGWSKTQIYSAITIEMALSGLLAALIGVACGAVLSLVATTVAASVNMVLLPVNAWQLPPWTSIVITILLVPICSLIGAVPQTAKAVRLDPDQVLRGTNN